ASTSPQHAPPSDPHPLPPRRSSDLSLRACHLVDQRHQNAKDHVGRIATLIGPGVHALTLDRFAQPQHLIPGGGIGPALFVKESRSEEHTSDSSHVKISYAVFCLKKK